MKKRIISLVLAIALVFAMSACTGSKPQSDPQVTPGEAAEGGEITVGLYNDLDASLDPHMSSSSAATREILFNIFEGLVKPDSKGNLVPAIASSYTVNDTADVYTFKLREGVQFHDGKVRILRPRNRRSSREMELGRPGYVVARLIRSTDFNRKGRIVLHGLSQKDPLQNLLKVKFQLRPVP